MAVCRSCGTDNPGNYRFCGQCGAALTATVCPNCGTPTEAWQRFCGTCATPLPSAPGSLGDGVPVTPTEGVLTTGGAGTVVPATVQERKLATVLFADVVGFTSLAERTDHEVVARMVDAAFRQLGEVVADHGGTVDKYMGDCVMATFGVPLAHDDDAERAVAAGLVMRTLGGDLAFSIGINSGQVMVTAFGSSGDATVIGDTVNVAARLEKAAGPGEVLCGALTAELVGARVAFRPRQPVLLKGKREPVEVWEAIAVRRGDAAEATDEGPQLVGRDDDLAFLQAQWQGVRRDGQSRAVVVCGDAGSGKSRLAEELVRAVSADARILRATYPAYGAMSGASVGGELMRQLGPVDDPELAARLRSISGDLDPSLESIDPQGLELEQVWAVRRVLEDKAADRPLLAVVDDVHRSGQRSLQLLAEVASRPVDAPVLTLLVGRSEPGDWLRHFPSATTVRLTPLARSDATALACALVADKPLAPDAAAFLVERAGGNPLYLRELVAMVRAHGSLVDAGDHYRLGTDDEVPATLQALLAARLDALESAQKLVFQHVAVLGDGVSASDVAALGATGTSAALGSLVHGGLLRRDPGGGYQVADPLLAEVAYEMLTRNLRGELHHRAADAVAAPTERARHLDLAADYLADDKTVAAEAAEALADAGEELVRTARYPDARRLLSRAVELGCSRASARLELARLQALVGNEKEALETLAGVADDPADPAVAAEREHTAANTRTFSDPAWALPRLEDAAVRWRALGNPAKEGWALANAGVAAFNLSRMAEAAHSLDRAVELFGEADDRAGAVAASSFLCLARPTDRRVPGWLAEALEFADHAGDRMKQMTALSPLAWNHFLRSLLGDAAQTAAAEGFARRQTELAEEVGAVDIAPHGRSQLVVMARLSGRVGEAADHAAALGRLAASGGHQEPWLAWAASFSVAVAGGASGAAPPDPPAGDPDPVAGIARVIIATELAVSGRAEEAVARFDCAEHLSGGPIEDLTAIVPALALVLAGAAESGTTAGAAGSGTTAGAAESGTTAGAAEPAAAAGRAGEARQLAQRAAGAAAALDASPVALAASALLAEISGDVSDLPPPPADAGGVAQVLVLRAHARAGDEAARDALRQATRALAMPGLALG